MKFKHIRNIVTNGLSNYLKVPVVLASQVEPEQDYPFIIYSVTAPYIPENTLGEYRQGGDGEEIRREQPTCTWSFTACSANRRIQSGFILGEDEAMELANQALGWFLHAGYEYTSGNGITIVDTGNVQERSVLEVDEAVRRYGFDVTIRYIREDNRIIATIRNAATIEQKGDTH